MGPRLGFSYDAWSSGLHGVLMFFAASSVAGRVERFHVLDQRGCVRWTVDAQRSGESPPPNRLLHALRFGMHPRTPPRQAGPGVDDHGMFAVPVRHSHYAKQFDGQLSLPAPDARADWSVYTSMRRDRRLTLDHGSV
ncbi:hypothetical protein MSEO_05360 [Mycobacterium seoulense]|uniref:Uncharacterized protein n=1 Tax=Mycobacterium seoulense TaxID=386911 RepID=A0A7I7NTP7_9MYCO|nr:hypothetical protein MSEO_05360 [Mycobacterium seoulense]